MENRKFKRAAKINRAKAFLFTLLFHAAILGALLNTGSYEKLSQLLPDAVVEWLGLEDSPAQEKKEDGLHRP